MKVRFRSRVDICIEMLDYILSCGEGGTICTHLMYRCNLSHSLFNSLLQQLRSAGLIAGGEYMGPNRRATIKLTQKGLTTTIDLASKYREMKKVLME